MVVTVPRETGERLFLAADPDGEIAVMSQVANNGKADRRIGAQEDNGLFCSRRSALSRYRVSHKK